MSAIQVLYDNWNEIDELRNVSRQGFLQTKVYGFYGDNEHLELIQRYNVDNDLSHGARVAQMVSDLMDLWPMYYHDVDKACAVRVALNHDIGELVVGDMLDDGCKEHDLKKNPEYQAVDRYFRRMPDEVYYRCMDYYNQFSKSDTFLGQSIRLMDKLDFLGKLIKLEGEGMIGKLSNKVNPSKRDLEFALEIDSDDYVDIVARGLLKIFQDDNFDYRLVQIGVSFLTCALREIGRPFYPWWPKEYPH